MAFTFTSFELLHLGFRMWLWIRILTKKIGGSTELEKKGYGSADLHTPIHPDQLTMSGDLDNRLQG